jgi:Uma2 family endonuclease
MATTISRPATEADLIATPADGHKYELVDGEIRRLSPAGFRHGAVAVELSGLLRAFVKPRKLGHLGDSSIGFQMPNGNVRSPDVSFVATGRFENDDPPVGYSPVLPDLAVEILSPSDGAQEILDKVGEYLDAGVRIVWVVDPQQRRVNCYRSLTDVHTLSAADDLDGEDVLPGFRCRLADLFQ